MGPLRVGLVGAAHPPHRVPAAELLVGALSARGHVVTRIPADVVALPRLAGLHLYEDGIEAVPEIILGLRRSAIQVAHALDPAAGWAAAKWRRHGGPPYVLVVEAVLRREHLVSRRRRIEMLREAVAGAAGVVVPSEEAAEAMRRYAIADPYVVAEWWNAAAWETLYRQALER